MASIEEEKELKEYEKPRYSLKDMYWFATKIGGGIAVIAAVYFRFVSVETTQLEMVKQMKEDKAEILREIEILEDEHAEDRSLFYRHVSDKDNAQRIRLDTKTKRNEDDIKELDEKIDRFNLDNYKNKK